VRKEFERLEGKRGENHNPWLNSVTQMKVKTEVVYSRRESQQRQKKT